MTRVATNPGAQGIWTAERPPDFGDDYREVRQVLRIALEVGMWRAYAAGTWWRYRPL